MIYLDSHATTPLDPSVAAVLNHWQRAGIVANTGSPNPDGRAAAAALQVARNDVAELVDGKVARAIFTSGATESNNLSLAAAWKSGVNHVISSPTEHPSVLNPLRSAQAAGAIDLELVPIGPSGSVDPTEVADRIRPDTTMISIQAANNETGIVNPIAEVGRLASEAGVLFHCDASQAAGKVPLSIENDRIDLLSLSGHKMYGPLGIGALVASERGLSALAPIVKGGGQELGLRSGTINVPGAMGLGTAAKLAGERLDEDATRLTSLRDRLCERLRQIEGAAFIGSGPRLPGSISMRVADVPSDALIASCPELAFSNGSACSSGSPAPSHVLLAMGLPEQAAEETIRLGLPRTITAEDVEAAFETLRNAIDRIRSVVHA